MQSYIKSSNLSSEEITTLIALRSKCVKGIRKFFKKMYSKDTTCPLKCNEEAEVQDTQDHLIISPKLNTSNAQVIKICDIFGTVSEQEASAKVLAPIIRKRKRIMDKVQSKHIE